MNKSKWQSFPLTQPPQYEGSEVNHTF